MEISGGLFSERRYTNIRFMRIVIPHRAVVLKKSCPAGRLLCEVRNIIGVWFRSMNVSHLMCCNNSLASLHEHPFVTRPPPSCQGRKSQHVVHWYSSHPSPDPQDDSP